MLYKFMSNFRRIACVRKVLTVLRFFSLPVVSVLLRQRQPKIETGRTETGHRTRPIFATLNRRSLRSLASKKAPNLAPNLCDV